jgi:membrane associated rhomboid family serine protease
MERAAAPQKMDFISLLAHNPDTKDMINNPMELMGNLMLLILGGTLLGGLMHLLMSGDSSALLVGASGAAMALLLTVTTLSPQSRMFPLPLAAGNVGLGVMISSLLLMLLDPDASIPFLADWGNSLARMFGKDLFRIGHACHFGGAFFGFLLGRWVLRRPVTLEELQQQRERREKSRNGD